MNRGESVTVRAYPDKSLARVVWQEFSTYVLVVRPEIYHSALQSSEEPEAAMGFPLEDVFLMIGKQEGEAESLVQGEDDGHV